MLNIALPKGRLGEQVGQMLSAAGYGCEGFGDEGRRLVLECPEKGVRYLLVKPVDVPTYVEHGAADLGIVGKDTLLESRPDVYELADLGIGRCRLCVAAREGYIDDPARVLRVATKFSAIARDYYADLGRQVEVIHLSGSVELAAALGFTDVILDLVESGATLRENHLAVTETLTEVSARLISNKASFKFKNDAITRLTGQLVAAAEKYKEDAK